MKIEIEENPTPEQLEKLGVFNWPIWQKEVSEFPWFYEEKETCYILEGHVTVSPEAGDPVEIMEGHLVTFPKGMRCTWKISRAIKKHYSFG